MRNLKRVLSLALACVMVIGMMVMTTGAADLKDYDEITNVEAVDVMVALGVLEGDDNGNYNPEKILTREEAAKIICYMLIGEDNADKLSKNTSIFTDVESGRWSAGYIAYCVNLGILAGNGDGTFNPKGELTGVAFAKMLLVALGYDPKIEGYVNNGDYITNIATDAINADIDAKLDLSVALTRDNAAQMAFQTLTATMVTYTNKGTEITMSDGTSVVVGAAPATFKTDMANVNYNGALAGTHDATYLQFCEAYFEDLGLSGGSDDMNRPAKVWDLKNVPFGSYTYEADYTVVVKKSGKDVRDMIDTLSKKFDTTTYAGNDTTAGNIVSVNGGAWAADTTGVQVGDTLEVYMDANDGKQVDQVIVTRYTGAYKLTADPITKVDGEDTFVRLPGVTPLSSFTDVKNVFGYEGLSRGDIVYHCSDGTNDYVAKAESFEGTLTGYAPANGGAGIPVQYIINGAKYMVNAGVAGGTASAVVDVTTPVYNVGYEYYTDNNGLIVFAQQVEETLSDYVVVEDIQYVPAGNGIGNTASVEARIVKMDGSVEIVKVASINNGTNTYKGIDTTTDLTSVADDQANGTAKWMVADYGTAVSTVTPSLSATVAGLKEAMMFTYKINNSGAYELTKVAGINVTTSAASVSKPAAAASAPANTTDTNAATGNFDAIKVNDNTVFLVQDLGKERAGIYKYDVFTGKANCPILTTTGDITAGATGTQVSYVYTTKNGVADYVYVYSYATSSVSGNTIYFLNGNWKTSHEVKNGNSSFTYYTYDAVVGGKVTEVKVLSTATTSNITTGALCTPTYNTDGYVAEVSANISARALTGVYGYSLNGTTLTTGKTYGSETYANAYACAEDAVVIFKDAKGKYTEMTASEFTADANDQIYVVLTSVTANNQVEMLYIVEKDADVVSLSTTTTATATFTKTDVAASAPTPAYTKFANTTAGATITIAPNAGCKIEYNATGWIDANFTSGTTISNNATFTTTAGTDVYVRVTAEDGSVAYYLLDTTA